MERAADPPPLDDLETDVDRAVIQLLQLWITRNVARHPAVRQVFFRPGRGYVDDDLAAFLELPMTDDDSPIEHFTDLLHRRDAAPDDLTAAQVSTILKRRLNELESSARIPDPLRSNLATIRDLIGLSPLEAELLLLAVVTEHSEAWSDLERLARKHPLRGYDRLLAIALAAPLADVQKALDPGGVLASTGLLTNDHPHLHYDSGLSPNPAIARALMAPCHGDRETLLDALIQPAAEPELALEDFAYIREEVEICVALLRASGRSAEPANILLHGAPGTGKTQLAKALARAAGLRLYEVAAGDQNGAPADRFRRQCDFLLCRRLNARRSDAAILFDEAESALPVDHFGFGSIVTKPQEKAWVNLVLDQPTCSTIWISNSISCFDPAYIRRFHYVLEVPNPPRNDRRRMVRNAFADLSVRDELLEQLAAHDELPPALLNNLRRIVERLCATQPEAAPDGESLRRALNQSLRAMRLPELPELSGHTSLPYDLAFVNAHPDATAIVTGLRRSQRGTLCFYGPPGTGKSALAAHIAERMDRPLMTRKASDLLDMYVGGTERNIAAMFREARRQDAILLLDEADSFLRDRQTALRSWEVTQTNELLVQMASFAGIFICSTNLVDDLDPAAARRFDLKVRFEPLTTAQLIRLVERICGPLSKAQHTRLVELRGATPGDVAAVCRRLDILGTGTEPEALIDELDVELRFRPDLPGRRLRPGFVGE